MSDDGTRPNLHTTWGYGELRWWVGDVGEGRIDPRINYVRQSPFRESWNGPRGPCEQGYTDVSQGRVGKPTVHPERGSEVFSEGVE